MSKPLDKPQPHDNVCSRMAKICERCHQIQEQKELLRCGRDGCTGMFIEEETLASRLPPIDHKRIAREVVKTKRFWFAIAIVFAASIGGVWTYVKRWALPQLQKQVIVFQSNTIQRLNLQVEKVETNVQLRLDLALISLTNRIVSEFSDPRIFATVSNVAVFRAARLMDEQIAPRIAEFTNRLAQVAELSLAIVNAQTDDRVAFDRLVKLRDTGSAEERATAIRVIDGIVVGLMDAASSRSFTRDLWDGRNTNDKATLAQYLQRYLELSPDLRMYLIHECFAQERFTLYDRIEFLMAVAENDRSLKCANQACYNLGTVSGRRYNLLGVPLYREWWAKDKTNYLAK